MPLRLVTRERVSEVMWSPFSGTHEARTLFLPLLPNRS